MQMSMHLVVFSVWTRIITICVAQGSLPNSGPPAQVLEQGSLPKQGSCMGHGRLPKCDNGRLPKCDICVGHDRCLSTIGTCVGHGRLPKCDTCVGHRSLPI